MAVLDGILGKCKTHPPLATSLLIVREGYATFMQLKDPESTAVVRIIKEQNSV